MAKILLTGAAGFIGSNLYMRLCHDHEIVALDNFSAFSNHQIKLDRLKYITGCDPVWDTHRKLICQDHVFYYQDISDIDVLHQIFESHCFDIVIHLAAMTGVRQSISNPALYEKSNVVGFTNMLEACRSHGVQHLIYASSSSVYGGNKEIPFHENAPIENLLNYYAVTKRMNELAAENYSMLYDIKAVGLRFFTVYGPWTRPDMATYTFINNIHNHIPITLYNNGNMERDFTYVDDITKSIELVCRRMLDSKSDIPNHAIYNIGGEHPINIRKYVETIEKHINGKAIIHDAPMNMEEMQKTFADCSKLASFIGFKPETDINEGIAKTVEWFLNYKGNKISTSDN